MHSHYAPNTVPLSQRLGMMKIGEGLQAQYRVVAGPLPERLAGLLAELEQSEPSRLSGLLEKYLRPFDRLDDVIKRSMIAAFNK